MHSPYLTFVALACCVPIVSCAPGELSGSDRADAGDSGGSDGDDPGDDAGVDSGLTLPPIEPSHLQLWLTADRGVSCANGEITDWADQSGHARPVTSGSHKGPECPATGHALAGVNLPYFSAPPAPGDAGPFNDETLDVDFSFLTNTDYTIFVVERRWEDRPGPRSELILGTDYPSGAYIKGGNNGCQIDFGYVYYDGPPALDLETVCYLPYSGTRGPAPRVPTPPPARASFDMVRLWQTRDDAGVVSVSPTVWQNGAKINVGGTSGGRASGFKGGSIGRALGVTDLDERFIGDIAEIVVFTVGLTDPERLQMEAYFKAHWQLP
jgi:hypothetical protein